LSYTTNFEFVLAHRGCLDCTVMVAKNHPQLKLSAQLPVLYSNDDVTLYVTRNPD